MSILILLIVLVLVFYLIFRLFTTDKTNDNLVRSIIIDLIHSKKHRVAGKSYYKPGLAGLKHVELPGLKYSSAKRFAVKNGAEPMLNYPDPTISETMLLTLVLHSGIHKVIINKQPDGSTSLLVQRDRKNGLLTYDYKFEHNDSYVQILSYLIPRAMDDQVYIIAANVDYDGTKAVAYSREEVETITAIEHKPYGHVMHFDYKGKDQAVVIYENEEGLLGVAPQKIWGL